MTMKLAMRYLIRTLGSLLMAVGCFYVAVALLSLDFVGPRLIILPAALVIWLGSWIRAKSGLLAK
jgi:hypothetical protein